MRKKYPNPEYPILQPIYGGKWAAHGDGWAVHGATREEALENYRKAELKYQEILARPLRQEEQDELKKDTLTD